MSKPEALSRLALAQRHVEDGRRIVAAQEKLVATIKARGANSAAADDLLKMFRRSLAIFEDDLLRLQLEPTTPPMR